MSRKPGNELKEAALIHCDSEEISLKHTHPHPLLSTFHLQAWETWAPKLDLTRSSTTTCFCKSTCSMPIMRRWQDLRGLRGRTWLPYQLSGAAGGSSQGAIGHRKAAADTQVNTVILSTSQPQQWGYELIVRSCLRACD